ncbi:hypothetical protein IKG24_00220 [Candidatus Saccharibacteria bacterium]|nr:hypothetical protein [Candidatus Saccharibacteria bacterium]
MNPSYNSGGPNVPGVKPGTIASGPDNGTSGGVAPVQPQPNRYIPPRQTSFTPPVMQIGDSPKRSKKGIIIGAILIVVALVLGILAVVMMPKGGNGDVSGDLTFNKLINYIANGEESTTPFTSSYSYDENYYFLEVLDSEDEVAITKAYDTVKRLLNDFFEKYDKKDETLNAVVKATKDLFDFIDIMFRKGENDIGNIISDAVISGRDVAKQKAVAYYDFPDDSSNAYFVDFSQIYDALVESLLDEVDLYKESGCIIDNDLDYDCMISKDLAGLEEVSEKVSDLYVETIEYFDLAENFVMGVFRINDMLNGNNMIGSDDA